VLRGIQKSKEEERVASATHFVFWMEWECVAKKRGDFSAGDSQTPKTRCLFRKY
jgi:hypothetical protein